MVKEMRARDSEILVNAILWGFWNWRNVGIDELYIELSSNEGYL